MYDKSFLELVEGTPDFIEYTFYKNLEKRKIILNEEVTDGLVERVIVQILNWNEDDKDTPVDGRKEIEIILNSPGGDVYLGMIICSVIEKSETPIKITTLGMAASMGALILISAAKHGKRYGYEFSNILIHDGSTALFGTSNKVKDHVKFQEEKDNQIKNFILRNTKITEEKYESMKDREWWMSAAVAQEYGILDHII
jgi:ATP-dependent Clp protease protease subunit